MKVKFVVRDILDTPADFYIATAVAADFKMSSGVAKQIKYCYGLDDVKFSPANPNGDCVLYEKFLFLVDKPIQRKRVNVEDLKTAFKCLKEIVVEKDIDKIAMPMVGTGCDGLDWDTEVFPAFCEVFDDTDIYVEVCVLSEYKIREDYDSKPNTDEAIIDSMVNAMVDSCNKIDIVFGAAKELVKAIGIPIKDAFDKVEGLYEIAVERFAGVSRDNVTTSESTASSHYSTMVDRQFMDLINKITK